MKDIQQLIKKNSQEGRYESIFPKTFTDAVIDRENGAKLTDILAMFNMLFLSYVGSKSLTRLEVPISLRKTGIWITYVLYDKTVVTEWYAGEAIDDTSFSNDSNWRDGSNSLVGDISISSDGYWVINGEVTTIEAQGKAGITPILRVGSNNHLQVSYSNGSSYIDVSPNPVYTQFRVLNNKLQQSTDLGNTYTYISEELAYKFQESGNKLQMSKDLGNTWEDVSDYVAAWFKFTGTTGSSQADNVGKIQISRDNGTTWTDLSGEFTNSLHIKGYVATVGALPSTAVQGDIYGVGPTYDSSDTEQTNPIYQLYVKDSTGWVNNGRFTSISAGVVQELGDSETVVMSQKAVTDELNKLTELENKLGIVIGEKESVSWIDNFFINSDLSVSSDATWQYVSVNLSDQNNAIVYASIRGYAQIFITDADNNVLFITSMQTTKAKLYVIDISLYPTASKLYVNNDKKFCDSPLIIIDSPFLSTMAKSLSNEAAIDVINTSISKTLLFESRILSNNFENPVNIEVGCYYSWKTGKKIIRADITTTGLIPCHSGERFFNAGYDSSTYGGNITYWSKKGTYIRGQDLFDGADGFIIPSDNNIAYFRISYYTGTYHHRINKDSVKAYDEFKGETAYFSEYPVHAPNIEDDTTLFREFLKNKTIEFLYDEESGANYSLVRINKEYFDGTMHKPIVVNRESSTTAKLLNADGTYNCVINAGIFSSTGADGIVIINGEVVKNMPSATHPQCKPLTIDGNGDLGYAAYNADANTLVEQGIKYAVCGFMPIIIDFDAVPESEWNEVAHYYENAQRQIIGQFDNGDYGILTSEGRGSANSDGWTILEAQAICINHGFKFAYNLDGGGSTELVVGKKMLNHIYEGTSGRGVFTFICF